MYSSSLPSTSSGYKDIHSLIKLIERIRAVGIYEQLESSERQPWTEFQNKFLLSISIQKLYSQIFEYFQGLQNIRTRDILIAYAFVYYEMDDDEIICNVAKQLIQCLHVIPLDDNYRSQLYKALHQFEREYIPWKMDDRIKILEKLSHMYWEYEVNFRLYETKLTTEEKEYFLNEKKTKQEECINTMKKIDNLNFFHQYKPVYVDSQSSTLLLNILRKAFWDRIKEDLFSNPPKYESLFSIFKEIRQHIEHMTKRQPSILIEYDEIIDIDYFIQRHQHGHLDLEFWNSRLSYIFNLLIQLDSRERETKHRENLQTIQNTITGESNRSKQFELCIDGLAYIMTRLIEIRELYNHVF